MRYSDEQIAVVGMACRFPGAPDLKSFWRLLATGGNSVTEGEPGSGAGRIGQVFPEPTDAGDACRFGAYVEDIDLFDPGFFRIPPVEAELLDPQHRMMLETSWRALENAGIDPIRLGGTRTGVYAGVSNMEYREMILDSVEPGDPAASLYAGTGTTLNGVSGRVAYALGLRGPVMAVDAACASALVAVHLAVTGLQRGEADLALAGGVNFILDPRLFEVRAIAGMLSPDGQCKAFDAAANGFVRGEGCGVVVLKRLGEAEADGDPIWCVIQGSAVNHAGAGVGYTVPNGPAQEEVIRAALALSGAAPGEIDYLEAHGTGTEAGDPVELEAAAAVYAEGRNPDRPLLIGSVKTNIGHLEAASGIAGFIKAALAMRAGLVPPHLHFHTPNPRVAWDSLPLRIPTDPTSWPFRAGRPPRSAVSAYGMSGTNTHLILEGRTPAARRPSSEEIEAPGPIRVVESTASSPHSVPSQTSATPRERAVRMLPLSGRTGKALQDLARLYLARMPPGQGDQTALADMAWSASVGRSHFGHRAGVVFRDGPDLRRKLRELVDHPDARPPSPRTGARIAFAYTGQGSQWVGMGRDLYEVEPVVRETLDRCEAVFMRETGRSLLDVMFGTGDVGADLAESSWAQPANYALQCALTALWAGLGITPDLVIGHSLGELSAAQTAGVYSLEEGMRFALFRGRLLGDTPPGAMAAIFDSRDRVETVLAQVNAVSSGPGWSLAADNGAHQVVSGPAEGIDRITGTFEARDVRVVRLTTTRGFHSSLLGPALDDLEAFMAGIDLAPPSIGIISNVTGNLLPAGAGLDGLYWRRHARQPVEFTRGVRALAEREVGVVVEIGPHSVLGPMISLCWPDGGRDGEGTAPPVMVTTMERPNGGRQGSPAAGFPAAVAAAYEAGLDLSFEGLYLGERRRRVPLPGYPFQNDRYWYRRRRRRPAGAHPLLGFRHESLHGAVMFQTELSAADPSWIRDHRVFGHVVAPGAMYGALAAEASLAEGARVVALEGFQLHNPLILPEVQGEEAARPARLQVLLESGAEDGGRRVELSGKDDSGEWIRHAVGNLNTASSPVSGASLADLAALEIGLSAADVAAHYRARRAGGIELGPSFRTLRRIRIGPGEALGEIALPPPVTAAGTAVHPLLLDGCFQVVAAARADPKRETETYLPFGWDRLWLTGPLPDRLMCHAKVRQAATSPDRTGGGNGSPEVLKADLRIFSTDGVPLGGVDGFTVKRATRAALLSTIQGLDHLLYEVVWRERESQAALPMPDLLSDPRAIAADGEPYSRYLEREGMDEQDRLSLEAGLERLARSYALAGLEELGRRRVAGESVDAQTLLRELGIAPVHGRLVQRLLGMLGRDVAPVTAGSLDAGSSGAPRQLAEELVARHPAAATQVKVLRNCGEALARVLSGRVDPVDVLFDADSSAADLYRDAPAWRAANAMLADVVERMLADWPEGRRLRVLEVGAGTGAATAMVLPKLPHGRFDYIFTDISSGFFADAEERFGDYDALRFKSLDIERSPVAQGFDPRSFDLVIAAGVLHATRDLEESLSHCLDLLAPSGRLLALETLAGESWRDMIFGLLEGWWRFEDRYRTNHALVGPDVWRRAMEDAGFDRVAFAGPGPSGEMPDYAVILAQRSRTPVESPGLWVLVPDRESLAQELATRLAGRDQTVVIAGLSPDGVGVPVEVGCRRSWRSFWEGLPTDPPLKGIVHMSAVDWQGPLSDTTEVMDDIRESLGSALAMAQGAMDAAVSPDLGTWFVTRGAQVIGAEPDGAVPGSALWGLGRVMMRETPDLEARLIDLDPATRGIPPRLLGEIMYPDREANLAFRQDRRLAARLVRSGADGSGSADRDERSVKPSPDRSYLITGGLGGIGGVVAEWLADRGARYVVLNGRRPPGEEASATIDRLRRRGVEVMVELADVADGAAVDAMLARIQDAFPPLAGVVHSVGMLADASLNNQTWENMDLLLGAKIGGAWSLHRATEHLDLEMFLIFSSMSGIRGTPGQANYASANAFLDQLASHRRARGLVAQVIQWGAWRGLGEAEEHRDRIAGALAASGAEWFTPRQGVQALERVASGNSTSMAVTAMDWRLFFDDLSRELPLFDELAERVEKRGPERREAAADLAARLRATSPSERVDLLSSFISDQLRTMMRLSRPPAPESGFYDLGLDSLMAVELRSRLNRALEGEFSVPNTAVYDHPDIAALAGFIAGNLAGKAGSSTEASGHTVRKVVTGDAETDGIAIVGMACRLPGADGLAAFWELLQRGGDAVRDGRNGAGSWSGLVGDPESPLVINRRGGFVEDLDRFDARFFNLAPVEAVSTDPQQRLLMETCWHALEDAGLAPDRIDGSRTGVYLGIGLSEYRDLLPAQGAAAGYFGGMAGMAAGRVAFALGLQGPAIPVELACASSLVAVHQAVTGLKRGETDLALAGGVNVALSPEANRGMAEFRLLSDRGQCRPFDAEADGFVRGEGCGVLVLKRLREAESDGDRIRGVIRGTAVNQSYGSDLITPSGSAQERVMEVALEMSGIEPGEVDYLEAHGVGSALGDAIEAEAAAAVYGPGRAPERPLLAGSVKANIGHLESASGVAGIIKTVLAMQRGMIPAQRHFNTPSPHLDWADLPIRIPTVLTEWPRRDHRPPRAGVSAFGITGANAHVIVEGYPGARDNGRRGPSGPALIAGSGPVDSSQENRVYVGTRLLPLSAKSPGALRELAARYIDFPAEGEVEWDDEALADMAWTAATGRNHFEYRAGIVFDGAASLTDALEELMAGEGVRRGNGGCRIAFRLHGPGSGWREALVRMYEESPAARAVIRRCDAIYRSEHGVSFLDNLPSGHDRIADSGEAAFPVRYAGQCAAAARWTSLGVIPRIVTAGWPDSVAGSRIAGGLTLEEGMRLAMTPDDPAILGTVLKPSDVEIGLGTAGEESESNLPRPVSRLVEMQPASLHALGASGVDVVVEIAVGESHRREGTGGSITILEGDFVPAVATAYEIGLNLALENLFAGEPRRRVSLPRYPFQRRRYWYGPMRPSAATEGNRPS